jgi:hypothetical protein
LEKPCSKVTPRLVPPHCLSIADPKFDFVTLCFEGDNNQAEENEMVGAYSTNGEEEHV